MNVDEFVKWIFPEAKRMGEIDPLFTVAQAAVESGWGKAAIGNNLFGITRGSSWTGAVKLVTTTEYFSTPTVKFIAPEQVIKVVKTADNKYRYVVKRYFRDYPSVRQCLEDHQAILKKAQFADAWPYRKDGRVYVDKIVDKVGSKYATDPTYAKTIKSVITTVANSVARQKL